MRPVMHPVMRWGWLLGIAVLLAGCQASVYRLPEVTTAEIVAVDAELRAQGAFRRWPQMSEWDARERLRRAWDRVHGTAVEICREVRSGSCRWWLDLDPSRAANAWAAEKGRVRVQLGIADQSGGDEQVDLTMAHEMAHKILDHSALAGAWRDAGVRAGHAAGRAVGLLAALVGFNVDWFVRRGRLAGARIGILVRSRTHEREADFFAVVIACRAGLDLDKARPDRVEYFRGSYRQRSTVLDSHPLGAERIAQYDRAVAEARATGCRLPPRDGVLLPWLVP